MRAIESTESPGFVLIWDVRHTDMDMAAIERRSVLRSQIPEEGSYQTRPHREAQGLGACGQEPLLWFLWDGRGRGQRKQV